MFDVRLDVKCEGAIESRFEYETWLRLLPRDERLLAFSGISGTGGAASRSFRSVLIYFGWRIARGVAGKPIDAELIDVPPSFPCRDIESGSTVRDRVSGSLYEVGPSPSSAVDA